MLELKPLSKTATQYVESRITEVVQCTSGAYATEQQALKLDGPITKKQIITQLKNGAAKLNEDFVDASWTAEDLGYSPTVMDALKQLFSFEETPSQVKAKKYNTAIDNKIEEYEMNIELAGKRLLDKIALGLINKSELPKELEKLARF